MGRRSTCWSLDLRNETNQLQPIITTYPPTSSFLVVVEPFNGSNDFIVISFIHYECPSYILVVCWEFVAVVYERRTAWSDPGTHACACRGGRKGTGFEGCRSGSWGIGSPGRQMGFVQALCMGPNRRKILCPLVVTKLMSRMTKTMMRRWTIPPARMIKKPPSLPDLPPT
jgi:hypothetical protein